MAPRWWIYAGVSLLRMLSFSFDYRWAIRGTPSPQTDLASVFVTQR